MFSYSKVALMSHADKKMLQILQANLSLQQYMNQELSDVQAGFRKGIGPRDQIATSVGSQKQHVNSRKNIYFCFMDYIKAFYCVDHKKLGKFLKKWEYQITLSTS